MMTPLETVDLEPWAKRRFIPTRTDLNNPGCVGQLYGQLMERFDAVPVDLEQVLLHHSELRDAIEQHSALLQIRFDLDTTSHDARDRLTTFNQSVKPVIEKSEDAFRAAYLNAVPADAPKDRMALFHRRLATDRELYCESNLALQSEIDALCQDYKRIAANMTVMFQGEERTIPQMNPVLREPDRETRENAWRLCAERRIRDRAALCAVLEQQVDLRKRMAANAGFDRYVDFRFREWHRFDYTPETCQTYHATIEQLVRPLHEAILQKRASKLGLDRLRPWDLQADPDGTPPLLPFRDEMELLNTSEEVFDRVDADVGAFFRDMRARNLFDLMSRGSKAPGGYCMTLPEARVPFVFMNLAGTENDLVGLFHEMGHAYHVRAMAAEPLSNYRRPQIEFAEVASFGMELMCSEHWEAFYTPEESVRAKRRLLEDSVNIICEVAAGDAFQFWLYGDGADLQDADRKWLELCASYQGAAVSTDGIEAEAASRWYPIPHFYQWPFYFIEYGIAKLGALQLWARYKQEPESAMADYKRALSLGSAESLPTLFEAAGIRFAFDHATIEPIVELLRDELDT